MSFFGGSDDKPESLEEARRNFAADSGEGEPGPGAPGGTGAASDALSKARAAGAGGSKGSGRKPAGPGRPRGKVGGDEATARAKDELGRLLAIETFDKIVRFPADVALIVTGNPKCNLDGKQVRPVAEAGQIAASHWLPAMEPKYLALGLFGLGMISLHSGWIWALIEERRAKTAPVVE